MKGLPCRLETEIFLIYEVLNLKKYKPYIFLLVLDLLAYCRNKDKKKKVL